MRRSSCSWTEGDELSFATDQAPGATTIRLVAPTRLAPSADAKRLEVKCQLDAQFASVDIRRVTLVSNARNVELYVAREHGTFEYACTTRGVKEEPAPPDGDGQPPTPPKSERYRVVVEDRFAAIASIRLRLLSLRGARDAVDLDALVVDCAPHSSAGLGLDYGVAGGTATTTSSRRGAADDASAEVSSSRISAGEDLHIDHLATIGAQLLTAAERRVLAHVDACCDRLASRFEAALSVQQARLQRIEGLLVRHVLKATGDNPPGADDAVTENSGEPQAPPTPPTPCEQPPEGVPT